MSQTNRWKQRGLGGSCENGALGPRSHASVGSWGTQRQAPAPTGEFFYSGARKRVDVFFTKSIKLIFLLK